MNFPNDKVYVGVDTSKHRLDIYISAGDIHFSVANDHFGIAKAASRIKACQPDRVIVESTGRHEFLFAEYCSRKKIPIVIANPIQIKQFAAATGQLAKTDKIDAQTMALFGATVQPRLTVFKPASLQRMSDLASRRRQLLALLTMEKNRTHILPKSVRSTISPVITAIKNQIAKIDKKVLKLISSNPVFRQKKDIIESMPGAGRVIAMQIICNAPELGRISNKQASALIGVAPMNKDSGNFTGRRVIRVGRNQVRSVMFMAMLSTIQHNPYFKGIYQRMVSNGKPKKTAIIACVRKMVTILNAMLRDNKPWLAPKDTGVTT